MGPFIVIISQLVITIIIEGMIMILWTRSGELLRYSVLVNLMTNPLLNIILMLMSGRISEGCYIVLTLMLELLAITAEMMAYKGMMRVSIKKALGISLVLNISSFVIGTVLGIAGYWNFLKYISTLQ